VSAAKLIPLNRSEHMYWAGEGYLGPINQPYVLRFDQPVDADLVRQTLRELVDAYPRMRGVVEPTAFTYKLRILENARHIDQLFDDCFRIDTSVDAASREALQAWHGRFMNEPISLERGLPWRARFFPHPTQPGLMFSVHHLIGDGRSMVQMLCAIMGRLNGQPIAPCTLSSPSMMPAVQPRHWWQWPSSIARWWRDSRAEKRAARNERVIMLETGGSDRCTTSTVRYHELPCPSEAMRALAKQHGTTVNTLLMALVANAFLAIGHRDGPDRAGGPRSVAALRTSIDLRRFFPDGKGPDFGNFVSVFTVRAQAQPSLAAQIASLETQAKAAIARFERRDFALPLGFYELLPWVGRTLYSHLIVQSKVRRSLPPLSCHISNLGSAEFINPKGAQVKLLELWPATISTAFLLGALSLNGKQFFVVISQNDEVPQASVDRFLSSLDTQVRDLMTQSPAAPQPVAAAARLAPHDKRDKPHAEGLGVPLEVTPRPT
jgi:NRPS condensation-like uncharacterized protein